MKTGARLLLFLLLVWWAPGLALLLLDHWQGET